MARKRIKAGERIEPGTYLTQIRENRIDTIARGETDVVREPKLKQGMTRFDGTIRTLYSIPGKKSDPNFRGYWMVAYFETELKRVTEALKGM
jgi:hypothetical protein